jgi:phosphohistidine phosphatase SixA
VRSVLASLIFLASVAGFLAAPFQAQAGDAPPRAPSCAARPDSALLEAEGASITQPRDKEVGRSSEPVVPSAEPVVPSASARASARPSAVPPDSARPPSRYHPPAAALIDSLKRGGYVLVFRHGKTDWGQRDAAVMDFADRAAQRNLSEIGRRESAEMGRTLAQLHIPVGAVLASPMWRCRDTATLAFGRADTTIDLFQRGRESREARLRMLSTSPAAGTNTVIVTHQDVLLPIMSLRRDELGEGEALILKPLGAGAFQILAQAAMEDWIRFLPARKP